MVFFKLLVFDQQLIVGLVEVGRSFFDQLLGLLSDLLHPCLDAISSGLEFFGVVGGIELLAQFVEDALLVNEQFIERIHEFLLQHTLLNLM